MSEETIVFVPNELEKKEIAIKCNEIAKILKDVKLVECAMILKMLTDALAERGGMKVNLIAYKKKGSENDG